MYCDKNEIWGEIKCCNKQNKILQNKLIKDGVLEHRCDSCNLTEWCGQMIDLNIHHINGHGKGWGLFFAFRNQKNGKITLRTKLLTYITK